MYHSAPHPDSHAHTPPPEPSVSVLDTPAFTHRFLPDTGLDEDGFAVYHWDVTNWASLQTRQVSPEFECAGFRWRILLFPRGNGFSQHPEMVSAYLDCADFSAPFPPPPTGNPAPAANGASIEPESSPHAKSSEGELPDSTGAAATATATATATSTTPTSASTATPSTTPPPGVIVPQGKKSYQDHVCAQFALALSNPHDPTEQITSQAYHRFVASETDWGFTRFAELRTLSHPLPGKARPIIERQSVRVTAIVRAIKDETGVLWHNFVNYDSKQATGYVGLKNQGATCYMNSLLQSLYCTNMFRRAVYEIPTEGEEPSESVALALQRVFYHLQTSDQPVGTTELTRSFGWKSLDSFLQHDVQEFNRVLQDKLETSMKGTSADGMISKLFVGKMKSYIKCINVDYESSRVEDFYDIQLNVKGMRNLMDSFRDYVQVERLDGDNQYQAEGYGLQDATKGVIFETFPPVLHLQLKRYEYDMERDTMGKINDRHEYPMMLDLGQFVDKESEVYGQDWNYALHGVLVHSGDQSGGHYFALIKPNKDGGWFRFDDDRVTPATEREVLEDNFGGEEYIRGQPPPPGRRQMQRFTNAYMLVYVRRAEVAKVLQPFSPQDIPAHLAKRIEQERLDAEARAREEHEQIFYLNLRLITEDTFRQYQGFDLALNNKRTQSLVDVPTLKVRKTDVFPVVKEKIGQHYKVHPSEFRVWALVNRQNQTVRPDAIVPDNSPLTIEKVREQFASRSQELRLFIEFDISALPTQVLDQDPSWTMVFLKRFNVQDQTLLGFSRVYVKQNSPVGSLVPVINELLQRPASAPLKLYEEIKPTMIEAMKLSNSFSKAEIQPGDIICFQEELSPAEADKVRAEGHYASPLEFYDYLANKVDVLFKPVPEPKQATAAEFALPLHALIGFDALAARVGAQLNWDPAKLRLSYSFSNHFIPIKSTATLALYNRMTAQPLEAPIVVYYELLDTKLLELEAKRNLKVYWMGIHNKEESERTYLLARTASLSAVQEELAQAEHLGPLASDPVLKPGADGTLEPALEPVGPNSVACLRAPATRVRLFEISPNGRSQIILPPNKYINELAEHAELFAEEVPGEELEMILTKQARHQSAAVPDMSQQRLIEVAHFTKDPHRANGVPFRFVTRAGEPLRETKLRLRARLALPEKEFSKIKVALLRPMAYGSFSNGSAGGDIEYLDDDAQPFDLAGKGCVLGLDHIDRSTRGHRQAAASAYDRGIHIS